MCLMTRGGHFLFLHLSLCGGMVQLLGSCYKQKLQWATEQLEVSSNIIPMKSKIDTQNSHV